VFVIVIEPMPVTVMVSVALTELPAFVLVVAVATTIVAAIDSDAPEIMMAAAVSSEQRTPCFAMDVRP